MKTDVRIRALARGDKREGFRSGNIDIDRFFQRYAGQNQFRHHIGTTYVAISDERIKGFVTVSPGELTADSVNQAMRKRLPAYPVPVLRISRLGVDERDQGQEIGSLLLRFAFGLALDLRDRYGCAGVVVDAKPDAVGFYNRLGFLGLDALSGALGDRPEPLPVFLPVARIAQATEI